MSRSFIQSGEGGAVNRKAFIMLILFCPASLAFTTTVNRSAGVLIQYFLPGRLEWFPESCVASCLAAVFVYVLIRPLRPFQLPVSQTPWRSVLRLSMSWLLIWLAVSTTVALVRGGWFAYTHGVASIMGFVVIAPFGEELLFRGTIYELTERAFPQRSGVALAVSSIFFALHHFQLHAYRFDRAAVIQVCFTFIMGLIWGRLRGWSQSIWPGYVVHVLTNLPGAFGK